MDTRELNDEPPNAKEKECLPAFGDPLNASVHDLPENKGKIAELQDSWVVISTTEMPQIN